MKNRVRQSLRFSFLDGICAAGSSSLVDNFVMPLAIALQATTSQIASLASVPCIVGALAQLQAGPLRNAMGRRKGIILFGVGMQAVCMVGLSATPWFPSDVRVPAILVLMTIFAGMGALATPLWQSLMCEYLPLSRRSGFFGWRNRTLGGVTMLATLIGGLVLSFYGPHNFRGFAFLISGAAVLRFLSLRFLSGLYEPNVPLAVYSAPTYRSCLAKNRNFMRFVLTCGLMGVSVNLSGAFLSVYMLKELKFGYLTYTGMIMAAQVTMFWMMGRWGRNADRAGNMKVVQMTARLLPLTAFLWIFSTNLVYLFAVQLISGMIWAGYNLCVANFVYDSVPTRERVHATALFNTVNGLAAFLGAATGGWLLARLPALGGHAYYTLILVGVAARALVGWGLFPRVREVRAVTRTRSREIVRDLLHLEPAAEA